MGAHLDLGYALAAAWLGLVAAAIACAQPIADARRRRRRRSP